MSFLDYFRGSQGERKDYRSREFKSLPIYQLLSGSPNWTSYKWSQYSPSQALNAYRKSVWLYACIRLRADNISSVPWVVEVKRGGEWEPVEDHPLSALLANPNPEIDFQTMMKMAVYWLDLTGDAWGKVIRNGANLPYEWWPLMPDSMQVIPGRDRLVDGWKFQGNGKSDRLLPEEVIHLKYASPGSIYYGLSPLQSAAKPVDIDMEAANFQKVTLQNHGVPVGIFTGEDDMTQDQYEQNLKWITEQSGPEHGRQPWVSSLKYQSMGNTPHELDFVDSRDRNRLEIFAAYAVPPPMVGVYDDATLNNIKTARRIFWMEGLIPVLREIEGQLNQQLAYPFGPDVRLTYDLSAIEALEQDQGEKMDRARKLWDMGMPFDRINTFLELGFDTEGVDGADVGYLPPGLLPTNFEVGDQEQGGDDAARITYGEGPEKPVVASGTVGATGAEPVADTALNGAQVTALQGIVQAVADGMLPAETAFRLITVAFPAISEQEAQAIITPLATFEQAKPEPEPNPFAQPAPVPPKGKPEDEGDNG